MAITGYFIVAICGIAIFITWAVRHKMDLVSQDYYRDEILYQQQIDRINRTRLFAKDASVTYDPIQQTIIVALPAAHVVQQPTGGIQLYRPSDARLDHAETLVLMADGTQHLNAKNLRSGLWKIRIQWTVAGQDYGLDQSVVIGGI